MARNQVVVLRNVDITPYENEHRLHFQWCRFDMGKESEYGYRFMWSDGGGLKPLRGGARIPSWEALKKLQDLAEADGWSNQSEGNI
mgnify:CR=1 FL=1